MMPDETATTTTTISTNPILQHGGKYADHEFVKIASKVIKGVEREPHNKFETILVNYDKMKDIKGERNLTKSEQRIYDRTEKLINKEFDAMFKKADTMLDQLDRKTPAQKGGGNDAITKAAASLKAGIKSPFSNNPSNADSPAPGASNAPGAPGASNADASNADAPDASGAPDASNPTDPASNATPPVVPAASNTASNATPAVVPPPKKEEKETSFMDATRPYRWIVGLLTGIWYWIKSLFTGAFSDKFEQLRKQFSADELFKLFGNDPEKIEKFSGEFKEQSEKLQRLVASGIGGAASASIDMILNAFSMSPVFGTTILVWRMFQNMLMIMGASLSVQAANNKFSTSAATIVDPKAAANPPKSGGGKAKAKNNVTKRLKTDIRQLNRSLKRYMHFPHHKGPTMSGSGAGSGYSYT